MNFQEEDGTKEQSITIRSAQSWEELLQAIDSTGGLQGSGEFFEAEELKELIEAVRDHRLSTRYLTRMDGLRDKADELLSRELQGES